MTHFTIFQPYLCESFYVLLEYARTAMFHWFFIEGLHLHSVLTIDVFPSHQVGVPRFEPLTGLKCGPLVYVSIFCILDWFTPSYAFILKVISNILP